MNPLEEMPLFPLNAVLFPHAQIMVHIFEERYRIMIDRCMREESPFGIVLIREGYEVGGPADPHLIGTACRIMSCENLEDGTMNIRVQGERRFRIRRFEEDQPYLVGMVEPIIEMEAEESPRVDALAQRLREDFDTWIQMLIARNGVSVQIRLADDLLALSFTVANFLPLDNHQKQHLLEITDTSERIAQLIPLLQEQLAEMQETGLTRMTSQDFKEWVSKN